MITLLAAASVGARVEVPLPIPNTANPRGLEFVTQAAVWDPPRSLLGSFTLTGALQVALGD